MLLLNKPRGWGKTEAIVRWAHENPEGIIVVMDVQRGRYLCQRYLSTYGDSIGEHRVVTYEEVRDGQHRGLGRGSVAIDDVDDLLRRFVGPGKDIELVTGTFETNG